MVLGALRGKATMRLHVVIRGRIGPGWYDIDRTVKVERGTTLSGLVEAGDRLGLPLATAVADSPHLAHTLMVNGERCPLDEQGQRELQDGDEIYLLAPLAGG